MKINPRAELLALGAIWGVSYLLISIGLRVFSPAVIVLVRTASGAMTLGFSLLVSPSSWRGIDRAMARRYLKYLPAQALVATTLPFLLISWGETRTTVATAGMLNAATPLFTFIFAKALLRTEASGVRRIAGLVVGFIGVAVILNPWGNEPGAQSQLLGSVVVLGASALYGYGFVFTRKYFGDGIGSAKVMAFGQIGFATVLSLPFLLVFHAPAHRSASIAPSLIAVLVLGVVQTGLATLMYHRVVRQLGATASSVVTYVIPLVAVVAGVVFAHNDLSASFVAGALVVLAAVFLVAGGATTRPEPAARAS